MPQGGLNFKKDVFEIYSLPLNFPITKKLLLRDIWQFFCKFNKKVLILKRKYKKKCS